MAEKQKRTLSGWTIDTERAKILDDGFRVTQRKDGSYHLKFFIADTSVYYSKKKARPTLLDAKSSGTLPDIDYAFKSHFLSLNESLNTQPAICVSMNFSENGILNAESINVGRVQFENRRQLTEQDATDLVRSGDEDMRICHELAQRIDQQQGRQRLEKIKSCSPGNLVQATFSNAANAALTLFATQNNIPLIFQNQKARVEALNDTIKTREEAYIALDVLYPVDDGKERLEASCHASLEKPDYSNTSTGNIEKGYNAFARFSSPMQSLMDCANVENLAHFLKTGSIDNIPFSHDDMQQIGDATGAIKASVASKMANEKFKDRENAVRETLESDDSHYLKVAAKFPHIGFVLKRIFEHTEQTGKGKQNLTHACIERLKRHGRKPAYLLKIALINNPQKTEAQKNLAQEARNQILHHGLSEEAIRLSVEQAGDFEAFFIEKQEIGSQVVYQPILIKDGERLSPSRIAPYDTSRGVVDHNLAVARAFRELTNAIADQSLVSSQETDIEWSKKAKKLLAGREQGMASQASSQTPSMA